MPPLWPLWELASGLTSRAGPALEGRLALPASECCPAGPVGIHAGIIHRVVWLAAT